MTTFEGEDLQAFLMASNTQLPFYNMVNVIAMYIQNLPFVIENFKGSVYSYDRRDLPNNALPAICVHAVSESSNKITVNNVGNFQIEIIRNINTTNRASIPIFKLNIAERIVQSLFKDMEFRRLLWTVCPYLGFFAESYSVDYRASYDSVKINFNASYLFEMYRKWADERGFNAQGVQNDVARPTDFNISQHFINTWEQS